jgi:phosphonate transport system permease protein
MTALALFAFWRLEFSLARLATGIGQLLGFVSLMFPPTPGSWAKALTLFHALAETVAIAFLGTILAAVVAFPLSFLAARNTTISRVLQFLTRRVFDGLRGIDKLIWALIWINVVGLGPFAGVLAFMMSDIGEFGKVYSEAIESADKRASEGVTSVGGSALDRIRFGVLPGVLPVIAGQTLYYFESNVRGGTIIGIVGAGGIGLHLAEQIRVLEWGQAAFIILLILVTVAIIDTISSRLRLAIIGRQALIR